MMRSKISRKRTQSSVSPVSSITSRRIASSRRSPVSRIPPGKDHQPFSGSWPRRTSRMRSPRKTNAPTPTNGRAGYCRLPSKLIEVRSFHVEPDAINGRSRRHVERFAIWISEREVRRPLRNLDAAERTAIGRINENPCRRNIKVTVLIAPNTARHSGNVRDKNALIRSHAVFRQIVGPYVLFIRVRNVKNFAIRRKRNAIRPAFRFRNDLQALFGRKMINAIEVQLTRVPLIAERWVGEVNLIVFANRDVVRRVQTLAVPTIGEHLVFALLNAHHAPRMSLAGVAAALRIERIAVRAVRIFTQHRGLHAGRDLPVPIAGGVAEDQKSIRRPRRPIHVQVARRDL